MNNVSPRSRRVAGAIARLGAATSALMLAFAIAAAVDSSAHAAENAGPAIVVGVGPTGLPTGAPLDEGGSATPFTLQLPVGAACTGDSASSDYRVQSYMVPSAVDPNTLTFGV